MNYPEYDWYGCYREGWGKGRLLPASFSHPAKGAYGLSERIYDFAIEQGWLKAGDCVLDPFAGVAGFALAAMRRGIHFFGVELEQTFVDMGQGCDCTGISKEDWVRYYGRWEKVRHKDGRHWCPHCLNVARRIDGEHFRPLSKQSLARRARIKELRQSLGRRAPSRQSMHAPLSLPGKIHFLLLKQGALFEQVEKVTTAYKRNSGKIPHSEPHHYKGNIEVWGELGLSGTGRIVQGDSRQLCEIIGKVGGAVSSPPYAVGGSSQRNLLSPGFAEWREMQGRDNTKPGAAGLKAGYGQADGQMGAMPEGSFDGAVSSAPFGNSDMRKGGSDLLRNVRIQTGRDPDAPGSISHTTTTPYGSSEGNIGNLLARESDFDAVMTGLDSNPSLQYNDNEEMSGDKSTDNGRTVQGISRGDVHRGAREEIRHKEGDDSEPFLSSGAKVAESLGGNAFIKRSQSLPVERGQVSPRISEESTERKVRPLRTSPELGDSPQGPQPLQQSPRQSTSALCELSPEATQTGVLGCNQGGGRTAQEQWPSGMVRVGLVLGSPPYVESLASDDPDKRGGLFKDPKRRKDKALTAVYGDTDGQIGVMPEGTVDGAVGSPPWEGSGTHYGSDGDKAFAENWQRRHGKRVRGGPMWFNGKDYGSSTGQLGTMPTGNVDASVSSPPWENALAQDGRGPNLKIVQEMEVKYARTYKGSFPASAYSANENQLSNTEGETFWGAARQIMEQTYQILKPGAVAIWTLKSFVRNKKIVDFPGQWKQLGEACGFETIAWIRAWQVEDQGTQFDLSGEAHKKEVHRISFFRRLHIQKYPHLAIEHEIVLVQRKAS